MKLALNYSKQAAELLAAGAIQFDLYKCPDWPELVAEANSNKPVYVHFTHSAGNGSLAGVDWGLVERLRAQTGTQHVNVHLQLAPPAGRLASEMDDQATETIIRTAIAEVRGLVERYGSENVVLENLPIPISRGEMLAAAADPAVIRRVVLESGCSLLLDVSHASISARTLGMDERTYIGSLPVERIAEIHMTGTGLVDGSLSDHLAMTDYDWDLFDWAMDNIRSHAWAEPGIVAVEYGGIGPIFAWRSESQVIARDIPRFYRSIHPDAPGCPAGPFIPSVS